MSAREIVAGAIPSAVVYKLLDDKIGQVEAKIPALKSYKYTVASQSINPNATVTLYNASHKFAVVLLMGDGSAAVSVNVNVGSETYTVTGDTRALFTVVNENVIITATNTDTTAAQNGPSVEVAGVNW